jgi:hypothetical protein
VLQSAAPYELAEPGITFFVGFFGALYPDHVRGEAYLGARQYVEAGAEFQKIPRSPWDRFRRSGGRDGPPANRKSVGGEGDNVKAKAACQDFLTLWKDADADVPLLKQARAEFARV